MLLKQAFKDGLSNFRRDLESPEGGMSSDLYSAISPMVSAEDEDTLTGRDAERTQALREQMRKGIVGLEYLTGTKKNTGETFYDKHPVQAVGTDLLSKAPLIGAGAAGLGVLENYRRQMKNMDLTEPASMSRSGNPDKDRSHPKNLLNPEKGKPREDISRLFGDIDGNIEHRLARIDALNNTAATAPGHLGASYKAIDGERKALETVYGTQRKNLQNGLAAAANDPNRTKNISERLKAFDQDYAHKKTQLDEKLKKLLDEAHSSKGASKLQKYVDVHESLQRAKEKGGLNKYIGEGLHKYKGKNKWLDKLIKHVAPTPDQAVADLLEKHQLTGAHGHLDKELIKQILADYHGNDKKIKPFAEKTLEDLANPKHQASGMRKALSRIKTPLAGGAALAGGGLGMYGLVKAIQHLAYSKDKTKEWKKTLLKSRGEFDRAEHIK